MFQHRPRLRFGGVYISTVNYVRPGASSPTTISWNTPVHIVTYYRYLRFFRDGSCISLLTTVEPVDVVHHLLKEHLHPNHGGLPSNVMKHALRGRWRLSGPSLASARPHSSGEATTHHPSDPHALPTAGKPLEPEGNLYVETFGPDSKYTYHLHLALRSASHRPGAPKNNKLVWRGFGSYNRLTDDWAEFGLRNDRAFFWSRVRSWGTG
jgi:F-box protein 9